VDNDAMTGAIRISVVIPTYNRARVIGRALDSVLAQRFLPVEIILVDDGSTDNTREVLSRYGDRVRIITQNHGGPSRARNLGVASSATPWVAFLDSDDVWSDIYLEKLAGAVAGTLGEAAVYFTNAEWETTEGTRTYWDMHGYRPHGEVELVQEAGDLVYREVQPMLLPFSLFRKDVYESIGGLHDNLWSAEDTHLFMRLAAVYPFCAVDAIGGRVTCDDLNRDDRLTSTFNTDNKRRWLALVEMYNDLLSRFPDLSTRYVNRLRSWLAGSHWRLSRIAWREGEYGAFTRELVRALRTHPKTLWDIILARQPKSRQG
jgi:glycosyltransferase involved in cell wall biosynthesis